MFARFGATLFAVLFVLSNNATADDASPAYDALLSQLKSGFTDIDYGQLRAAYAASAGYSPYHRGGDDEKQLTDAMKASDCPTVLSTANKMLDANFTNITAHVLAASCARKLRDESSAQYHRKVAQGLLASIARSGDGQSPQSAYVVIAVDEEYAFLSTGGYRIKGRSLVQFGQHECDAIDVVDGNGAQKTVYFNVDRPWAWLAQKFPPKSADKAAAAAGH